MTAERCYVIVGASLAGVTAAATLRAEGFDGRVLLVGAEDELPYERPPLSKGYLRGETPREELLVHPAGFYAEQDIEHRAGTVATELDPATRTLVLAGGERVRYDRLLLATGAAPRRLTIPGADLPGVHVLRSVDDADALRDALARARSVAVVGAGWIGAEVAAAARDRGREVTMIDPLSVPLERVLGAEMGAVYRDLHADHGVRLLLGTGVEAFEGDTTVERVRTSDGRTVDADVVVVGVGVLPRAELAAAAGLAVDGGVLVDARLRTSAPDIFAAGDVAVVDHAFYGQRVRVEHWDNAIRQGEAAGRAMLDRGEPFAHVPYFFSDQYDVGMEYSGWAPRWDRVVVRGDPAARAFIAFWMSGAQVAAAMNVNVWDVSDPLRALIGARAAVPDTALADPDVALEELAALHGQRVG